MQAILAGIISGIIVSAISTLTSYIYKYRKSVHHIYYDLLESSKILERLANKEYVRTPKDGLLFINEAIAHIQSSIFELKKYHILSYKRKMAISILYAIKNDCYLNVFLIDEYAKNENIVEIEKLFKEYTSGNNLPTQTQLIIFIANILNGDHVVASAIHSFKYNEKTKEALKNKVRILLSESFIKKYIRNDYQEKGAISENNYKKHINWEINDYYLYEIHIKNADKLKINHEKT